MTITHEIQKILVPSKLDKSPSKTELADMAKENTETYLKPLGQSPLKNEFQRAAKVSTEFNRFFSANNNPLKRPPNLGKNRH